MSSLYSRLPSVDRLLAHDQVRQLSVVFSHKPVVAVVRHVIQEARTAIRNGGSMPAEEDIVDRVVTEAHRAWRSGPRKVINATGVILHTNLGRAPLSSESLEAMEHVAQGYSDLELDLSEGKRGSRQTHVEVLLRQLTGADGAMVVNNNAAGVLLGLTALAAGHEVILSRGQAVEIGGGFRIPEILRQSGASIVEVGTTNRTYLADYESALTERTGAILTVHPSNFRITGFTHAPRLADLVSLGTRYNIPVLHDLGGGCLLDTTAFSLAHEPMPQESISTGVTLAFFSGDKMLGGPQSGIVVGKSSPVAQLKRHPLARAMRIDKLSLAALTVTLLHYLKGEATTKVPIWRMLTATPEELKERALRWQAYSGGEVVPGQSTVGGGSLPGHTLESWLLSVSHRPTRDPDVVLRHLRQQAPPIIGRIDGDRVVLDPRTVLPEEEKDLLKGVRQAISA